MGIDDKATQSLGDLLEAGESVEGLYGDLRAVFAEEKAAVTSRAQFKVFRDRWLSRKNGLLTLVNDSWLKAAPRDRKPQVGRLQNETRRFLEAGIQELKSQLEGVSEAVEPLDVTLPGPARSIGATHPIRLVFDEIQRIFRTLGYSTVEGPELESYYYNFEALNFPPDHPAVDEMDTLFVEDKVLLRTHTSPNQIRIMERQDPPVRYLVRGKVYRHDTADSTHSPMFHQIEGFTVDEHITFSDLKGTLDYFLKEFFGSDIRTRFRPSFFPFTEPSAEVDISCLFCAGRGCRICKQTGFIEVLGCGLIDPEVFRHVGYDPERYSGFAFGLGIDRFAMLRYDINDIQLFFQGDVRFLRQFR